MEVHFSGGPRYYTTYEKKPLTRKRNVVKGTPQLLGHVERISSKSGSDSPMLSTFKVCLDHDMTTLSLMAGPPQAV